MGCDGGTIPRRDELVRVKKKPEQKDKDAEREFRWLHCTLTQQRLQEPIVMCGMGRLYSKQKVLEYLLEKKKMPESAMHIQSMNDIKTLNLTPNPAFTDEDKTEGLLDTRHAPYICKLNGIEMAGKFRFLALWSCGCVMSERALKEMKSTLNTCPLCLTGLSVEDWVVLNGSDEDIELMRVKIAMRDAKRKAIKKEKKKIRKYEEKANIMNEAAKQTVKTQPLDNPSTSKDIVADNSTNGVTKKINIVANLKRSKVTDDPLQDPDIKRLRVDCSVAKDPKATDVYKSLFTTHKSEKEQSRAHWVTYNPFYN